jgi:hypothetical protein
MTSPVFVIPPLVLGPLPNLDLAVVNGGVRMPAIQIAETPAAEELPVRRAGSAPGRNAFLPDKPSPAKAVVPVRPRKQARH